MIRRIALRPIRGARGLLLLLASAVGACSDAAARVRNRVDSTLAADDSVGMYRVAVDNRDGTVTLSATVPTQAIRQRVVRLAAGTPGVTDVVDRIVVRASQSPAGGTKGTSRPRGTHHGDM